jgi:nucleotide-binding universal stress UspA family protein
MIQHILVPLDGSETAEVVLPYIKSLAQGMKAKLTLVRVVDVGAIARAVAPAAPDAAGFTAELQKIIDESVAAELADARAYLDARAKSMRGAGFSVDAEVREGSPSEQVLAAIEAEGVDMVAIASHGRSGISRTLFGSVADELIRNSGKPVLVIKAPKN